MQVSEAIDQILGFSDNVSPAGADYADRRQRILFMLIEETTQTYFGREWNFRLKMAVPDLTIPTNRAYAELPADYLAITKLGHVYDMTRNGSEMIPAQESEVTDLLAQSTQIVHSNIYTIFGRTTATPPLQQLWIPENPQEVILRIWYCPKMPVLDETMPNNDNLAVAIPEQYHQTVIIPGTRSRARRSKGDTRWQEDKAERMDGFGEMVRNNRRFQGGEQRLPSFFGNY